MRRASVDTGFPPDFIETEYNKAIKAGVKNKIPINIQKLAGSYTQKFAVTGRPEPNLKSIWIEHVEGKPEQIVMMSLTFSGQKQSIVFNSSLTHVLVNKASCPLFSNITLENDGSCKTCCNDWVDCIDPQWPMSKIEKMYHDKKQAGLKK